MREQETEADDTVEVWGSTPHGPTIQNKDLARIPKKHSRVQKDTFLRPICVLLPETFLLPTALGPVLRRVGDGCTSQLRRKHQRHHSRLRSVLGGRHRLSIDVQRGSQRRMPHQFLHHLEFRADAPQKRRVGPPKVCHPTRFSIPLFFAVGRTTGCGRGTCKNPAAIERRHLSDFACPACDNQFGCSLT